MSYHIKQTTFLLIIAKLRFEQFHLFLSTHKAFLATKWPPHRDKNAILKYIHSTIIVSVTILEKLAKNVAYLIPERSKVLISLRMLDSRIRSYQGRYMANVHFIKLALPSGLGYNYKTPETSKFHWNFAFWLSS